MLLYVVIYRSKTLSSSFITIATVLKVNPLEWRWLFNMSEKFQVSFWKSVLTIYVFQRKTCLMRMTLMRLHEDDSESDNSGMMMSGQSSSRCQLSRWPSDYLCESQAVSEDYMVWRRVTMNLFMLMCSNETHWSTTLRLSVIKDNKLKACHVIWRQAVLSPNLLLNGWNLKVRKYNFHHWLALNVMPMPEAAGWVSHCLTLQIWAEKDWRNANKKL